MKHNPIDVKDQKQLFLDKRWFENETGISLTVNPPEKREVNWFQRDSWDECVHAYLNVMFDEGKYRMWYGGRPDNKKRLGDVASAGCQANEKVSPSLRMCYAESEDGVNWIKPKLNIFRLDGMPDNNIVMPGAYGSVMKDQMAPPEHRYKALCNIMPNTEWDDAYDCVHGGKRADGTISYFMASYLLTSPDGINWKRQVKFASPFFHDSQNQLLYDRRLRKYVAYFRWKTLGRPRTVARSEFEDPMSLPWPWKENPNAQIGPGGTLERTGDELETVLLTEPDSMDPPDTDIYCPCVWQYEWADDTYYLIFMPVYRHYPVGDTSSTVTVGVDSRGKVSNDGPIDIRLAVSADGRRWSRPDRRRYVGLGTGWDGGCLYAAPGLIRKENEIIQYYVGKSETHGYGCAAKIGMLLQRLDGFVSADADYRGGGFTTPLMVFEGNELRLNADCSALGSILVEIRNERGMPIPAYRLDECAEVDRNHISVPACWKSKGSDVGELMGKPIKLHFKMRDCKLYSFQFVRN